MPHEGPKLTLRQLTRVICEHVHVHVSRKAFPLESFGRSKEEEADRRHTPLPRSFVVEATRRG